MECEVFFCGGCGDGADFCHFSAKENLLRADLFNWPVNGTAPYLCLFMKESLQDRHNYVNGITNHITSVTKVTKIMVWLIYLSVFGRVGKIHSLSKLYNVQNSSPPSNYKQFRFIGHHCRKSHTLTGLSSRALIISVLDNRTYPARNSRVYESAFAPLYSRSNSQHNSREKYAIYNQSAAS